MNKGGAPVGVQADLVKKYENLLTSPDDLKSSHYQYSRGFYDPIPTGAAHSAPTHLEILQSLAKPDI